MAASNRFRLALFGPILPYRSGIAHYSTQLHRALQPRAQLQTISFKKQYPAWLFPGKSDVEPGQENYREKGVDYLINVYSPFSLRRAADRVAKDCDLAIFNWWTLFWQPGFAYMSWHLRKRGIKTVFLCHNLFDHEAKGIKRRVAGVLLKQTDGYIVHSEEQAQLLHTINSKAPVLQKLHPIYNQYPKAVKNLPKRGRLELLFFGLIRPYKGLEVLLQALEILDDKDVYLTIVGEPWGNSDQLQQRLSKFVNIEARLEYVDDQTAANYFARADVVVLPYLSATGSGVVALAYNYSKPVLATKVGGLMDAVIDEQTGWLVPANAPKALAAKIKQIKRSQSQAMTSPIKAFCREHSWANMADAIIDFSTKLNHL